MKLTRSLHSTGRSNLPAAYILENDGVTSGGDYLNSNSCHKPSESITAGPRPSAGTNIIIAQRIVKTSRKQNCHEIVAALDGELP